MVKRLQEEIATLKSDVYCHISTERRQEREAFRIYADCNLSEKEIDTPYWVLYEEYYEYCYHSGKKPMKEEVFEALWSEYSLFLDALR